MVKYEYLKIKNVEVNTKLNISIFHVENYLLKLNKLKNILLNVIRIIKRKRRSRKRNVATFNLNKQNIYKLLMIMLNKILY